MKKIAVVLLLLAGSNFVQAQSHEVTQLLLNVEKLSQLKNILRDMKKGYTILSRGYEKIRDISEGNFSLHEVFLGGLLAVSPEIKNYYRVREIIAGQKEIVRQYRAAFKRFRRTENFSEGELRYLSRVYAQLFEESKRSLNALLTVITSSSLRMNDGERIAAIDRISDRVSEQLTFLRVFNEQVALLNIQREKEKSALQQLKTFYERP